VFSTFERTLANDRPVLGEHLLPQCANSHCARVKLKRNEKFKPKQNETITRLKTTVKNSESKNVKVK
jgi:hypothetical protein